MFLQNNPPPPQKWLAKLFVIEIADQWSEHFELVSIVGKAFQDGSTTLKQLEENYYHGSE